MPTEDEGQGHDLMYWLKLAEMVIGFGITAYMLWVLFVPEAWKIELHAAFMGRPSSGRDFATAAMADVIALQTFGVPERLASEVGG